MFSEPSNDRFIERRSDSIVVPCEVAAIDFIWSKIDWPWFMFGEGGKVRLGLKCREYPELIDVVLIGAEQLAVAISIGSDLIRDVSWLS